MDVFLDGGSPAWRMGAPREPRDLFDLLALYRPDRGLEALIGRVQAEELSTRLIYHVAHRRLPDSIEAALAGSAREAHAQLAAAIRSAEFRDNIVLNLMHAFPELRRDVLLRLPGQSASPLIGQLGRRRAVLPERLGAGEGLDGFLAALAGWVSVLRLGCDVLVDCAHDVERLIARAGVRPQDRLMVVIDTPDAVMVGRANQLVARLLADPEGSSEPVQTLQRRLGVPRRAGLSDGDLRRLVERVLLDPVLSPPNPICATLSHLAGKTAGTALLAAAALDIEITTRANHAAWLLERWDVVAEPEPPPPAWQLDAVAARAMFGDLLDGATGEDRRFCDRVARGLRESGACWISGTALARVADEAGGMERPALRDPIVAGGDVAVHAAAEEIATAREAGDLAGLWLGFGRDGNGGDARGAGWSVLEDHSSWTNATTAVLRLPRPAEPGGYRLMLDASPFVVAGRLPRQRLGVRVNGRAVAVCAMTQRSLIDVAVPWDILAGADMVSVELLLPDAVRPSELTLVDDDRQLGLYVRSVALLRVVARATPEPAPAAAVVRAEPTLQELALSFESLGENCELGLVQRKWGAEPLGLLRFASSPLDKLLPALRNRFRQMGDAGMLEVQLGGGQEYMVLDRKYGFLYHAWAKVGELTPEQILTREYRRVPFLIRKLTEDLQGGDKIFVYHGLTPLIPQQVRAMSSALRLYGPGRLLWLELADAEHPAGTVEWAESNVIKGYIDRFAPGENAHDFSLAGWEAVCRAALRLAEGTPLEG